MRKPKVKAKGKGKYVIIDGNGKEILVENVDALFQFKNGFAIFRVIDNDKNCLKRYGYMKETGERLSNRIYDHADNFDGKFAKVKNDGMTNYIDRNGGEVLSWNYKDVEDFLYDTFVINYYSTDGRDYWGVITINEEFIVPPTYRTKIEAINVALNNFEEFVKTKNDGE